MTSFKQQTYGLNLLVFHSANLRIFKILFILLIDLFISEGNSFVSHINGSVACVAGVGKGIRARDRARGRRRPNCPFPFQRRPRRVMDPHNSMF